MSLPDINTRKIPTFLNINDNPAPPTNLKAGNGAHLISVYNSLIDDLGTSFSSQQSDIIALQSSITSIGADLSTIKQEIQNLNSGLASQIQSIVQSIFQNTAYKSEKWIVLSESRANYQVHAGDRLAIIAGSGKDITITLPTGVPNGSVVYFMNISNDGTQNAGTKIYFSSSFKGSYTPNNFLMFDAMDTTAGLIQLGSFGGWYPTSDSVFVLSNDPSNSTPPAITNDTGTEESSGASTQAA